MESISPQNLNKSHIIYRCRAQLHVLVFQKQEHGRSDLRVGNRWTVDVTEEVVLGFPDRHRPSVR